MKRRPSRSFAASRRSHMICSISPSATRARLARGLIGRQVLGNFDQENRNFHPLADWSRRRSAIMRMLAQSAATLPMLRF